VRVTHPFHPLSGQALVCVGERCNWYGVRVLLSVDDDTVCAIPQQWTDLVAPDPEVVMGDARALMRVADLVELAKLVDASADVRRWTLPRTCQVNCAANVTQTPPPVVEGRCSDGVECGHSPPTKA